MQSASGHKTLLVIGAGPKGVAIAAKRFVLAQLGMPVPNVVTIDYQGLVAHWAGQFGFTDGRQLLGTRPEKDIGYPYGSTYWGSQEENSAVNNAMLRLSWQSYVVNQGRYIDWIDRGRTRPTHREWAGYLQWVAQRTDISILQTQVRTIALSEDQQRWKLICRSSGENEPTLEGDGLVITGPGSPITIAGQPTNHPRVMDGGNYWQHVGDFARLRDTIVTPLHIGIIGTGETAAAIVTSLVNTLGDNAFIEVISPYGVLYSRDEGFEENRLFSDPDAKLARLQGGHQHELSWLSMTEANRREFVRRTDRGVFSLHAMEEINRAENVRSIMGTARRMEVSDRSVAVDMEYDGRSERDQYDYVIVAIGFNPLSFTNLLDEQVRQKLGDATQELDRLTIERSIGEDLSIQNFSPRLHLPMLAGVAQGPGFPNLSCLGLLSDRILHSY